ncbi:hypothetical protein DFQ01_12922 [Paenibacillus cellulosilyticus]|uniref:Butirosin biosynthesis protein H-like n=1 Tax=Paenibacillus cellulosilyticus TaxID=375489 RepID=A0A2V2YVV3_9BACL|nr:hypothetical protein [Paenibacillus cellulosilyticus]PWV95187.1 hypothetical protein DFQ01_12922 [Paenibacillus cellulosilyticus]QKS46059.1 hypothetical protein HUB94_17675 [Paenibacillus cellulosilyticus]
MNECKLPIFKPFIFGYVHHADCFSMLDLDHEILYKKWFMNHFIQLVCPRDFVEQRLLLLDFCHEDFYSAYAEIMDIQIVHQKIITKYGSGILEFIFDCIDDEQYIQLNVNEFYIPGTIAYQSFDNDHGVFIYGYNKSEQIVYARYFKNELYKDGTLTFDEVENAFGNAVLKYPWTVHSKLFKKKDTQIAVDHTRIMNSIEDLMKSRIRYRGNESKVYGLQVYQCIRDYARLLDKDQAFDIRSIHLIYEHKKAMVKRFEFAHQFGMDTSRILPALIDLANKFKFLRIKILKSNFLDDSRLVVELVNQLNQLEEEEYKFYEFILNTLDEALHSHLSTSLR